MRACVRAYVRNTRVRVCKIEVMAEKLMDARERGKGKETRVNNGGACCGIVCRANERALRLAVWSGRGASSR